MRQIAFRWVLAFASVLSLPACSMTYRAEPIEAWVVDAETAQPIEGVVVTANWELEIGTVGGNVPVGQLMVMEAATDQSGRFYFPAWGPKSVPPELPHPLKSPPHLVTRDPQLLLFKSGYKWRGLENYFVGNYNKDSLRKSDWNGKTIKMERFKGDLKEYARHLDCFDPKFIEEDCNWKTIPNFVLALDRQKQAFRQSGIESALYSVEKLERMFRSVPGRCGSPNAFFQDFR